MQIINEVSLAWGCLVLGLLFIVVIEKMLSRTIYIEKYQRFEKWITLAYILIFFGQIIELLWTLTRLI